MGSHNGHTHLSGHTPPAHEHADDWHHHDLAAEGMPQGEHGAIASTAVITKWYLAIVLTVIVTVITVFMYFTHYTTQYRRDHEEATAWTNLAQEARSYKSTAQSELSKAGTIGTNGYRLPIDQAMDKVAAEYAKAKPAGAK